MAPGDLTNCLCQFWFKAPAQHFKACHWATLGQPSFGPLPHSLPWTSGHSLDFFLLCPEVPPLHDLLPLPEFVWLSCLQPIESGEEKLLGGLGGYGLGRRLGSENTSNRKWLFSDCLVLYSSQSPPRNTHTHTLMHTYTHTHTDTHTDTDTDTHTHTHTHTHTNFPVREQDYLRRLLCEVRNSWRSKYL
jgi:hypothetical protein